MKYMTFVSHPESYRDSPPPQNDPERNRSPRQLLVAGAEFLPRYLFPSNSSARASTPYSFRSPSIMPAECTATARFFSPS